MQYTYANWVLTLSEKIPKDLTYIYLRHSKVYMYMYTALGAWLHITSSNFITGYTAYYH
jgi:hypothetical protein